MQKSTKKTMVIGGVVGAGILALAGTALALRAKSQPPAVVRVVGAAPDDNLTVYLIADSSLLYAKIGNWQSAKVGMWDSMIDDVYARKSEWSANTTDWTNIYDDLLQLKLSYCNEFGIPYSNEQRNRDMDIRNQRVISSNPSQPATSSSSGWAGSINAGNTNPFAVSIGGGVKSATVAQYGCLANASAPSVVDNVNIGTYPFENYRGFISKTIGMDWWGPKIRYPFYGQTVYVQPKFSSTSTPEQHIISDKKLGVSLWGWESGMYPASNLAGLINEVRRYEGVWNAKCPQNPRGCATIGGANDFYAQLAHALNHYVANV